MDRVGMESVYKNNVFLIMDNDSGYISNNLDLESNSNASISLDNSGSSCSSTVNILRSFIPKPIFLSEDALLERPVCVEKSPDFINSSVKSEKSFPSFSSEVSDASIVIPIADTIYFEMDSAAAHSSPVKNVLANITNTQAMQQVPEVVKKCSDAKTPSKVGIKRKFNESLSPDLFSDENCANSSVTPPALKLEEPYVHKLDRKFLKKLHKHISGIPPPPELTIVKFTVDEMLKKLDENKELFASSQDLKRELETTCLIDGEFNELRACFDKFPQVLHLRHHGLHHNRSKLSEEIEHLCEKYAARHLSAETQSTFTVFDNKPSSPAKRKLVKQKFAASKSPGRRLSHLARRRITFSCNTLGGGSTSNPTSSGNNSRTRQILINQKKLELLHHRKSPRKTPNKSPVQRRTPSSSAKKKLRMRFRLLSGDFKETDGNNSKRALFQSPEHEQNNKFNNVFSSGSSVASCSSFNAELKSLSTKRALFSSPNKHSPLKKRKRDENDDENVENLKFPRSQSLNFHEKPSASFPRTKSDSFSFQNVPVVDLSAAHKKKLQWAVYESLKLQNITTGHPQFKNYASVLARVTRRVILTSNVRIDAGGTSERMLRIAKHYSFAVVKGKSVEEIMAEFNMNKEKKTATAKPVGYVAPPSSTKNSGTKNVLRDNSSNNVVTPESRIDRIRKVINFEDK